MKKLAFIKKLIIILFIIFTANFSYASISFQSFKIKQASLLDFLLLKIENRLIIRARILGAQALATRVQYSNVSTEVHYDRKEKKIIIKIHAIMDKSRYARKKYKQKLSDCNIVRNLIFYKKYGYTLFRQKRDLSFSEELMKEIFKQSFLHNLTLNEKEIEFLMNNMFVQVNVVHPIDRTELTCKGKVNDFELH